MKTLITLLALAAAPAAFAETIPALECTPIDPYGIVQIQIQGAKPSRLREIIPMVFSSARPELDVYARITNRTRSTDSRAIASRPMIEGPRRPSLTYSFEFPSRHNRGWTQSLSVTIPSVIPDRRYVEFAASFHAGDSRPVPFRCVPYGGGPQPGPGASGRN